MSGSQSDSPYHELYHLNPLISANCTVQAYRQVVWLQVDQQDIVQSHLQDRKAHTCTEKHTSCCVVERRSVPFTKLETQTQRRSTPNFYPQNLGPVVRELLSWLDEIGTHHQPGQLARLQERTNWTMAGAFAAS
jgi:hypothetical protein